MRVLPLHDLHLANGAILEARDDVELVLRFTDPRAELEALERTVGLVDRSTRAVLRVVGPEAKLYLHGMVTNEVKGLAPGTGVRAAILTAQGKMLGDARILALGEEELLLDLEPAAMPGAFAHLEKFLISEDCELSEVTEDYALLGVYGPRAGVILRAITGRAELSEHQHVVTELDGVEVRAIGATPFGAEGFELLIPRANAAALFTSLERRVVAEEGRTVGDVALEANRVAHALARFGADMDEATIPLEANLERAISYTKGCYIGQEVVAKATYRGQVRRKLVQVEVSPGARTGDTLLEGEKSVGTLRTVIDPHPSGGPSSALAYLRRDRLQVGASFALERGGTAVVRWVPAPRE